LFRRLQRFCRFHPRRFCCFERFLCLALGGKDFFELFFVLRFVQDGVGKGGFVLLQRRFQFGDGFFLCFYRLFQRAQALPLVR